MAPQPAWRVDVDHDGTATVSATGADPGADGLSIVRAAASALWAAQPSAEPPRLRAGDDTAGAALRRWSLLA